MKLQSVQYLRATAATAVVLFHTGVVMNDQSRFSLVKYGEYGVDLFFLISGFVMVVTSQQKLTPSEFLRKRIARVAPMYWIATLLIATLAIIMPNIFRATIVDPGRLIESLLFIPHYHAVQRDNVVPILNQGWTLTFEMYFYVVFAAFLLIPHAGRLIGMAMFFGVSILVGKYFEPHGAALAIYTNPMLLEFVLGMSIGYVYLRFAAFGVAVTAGVTTLGTGALLALSLMGGDIQRWLAAGIPSAMVLASFLWIETRGCRFSFRPILVIAEASYVVYLFHNFALGAVRFAGNKMQLDWQQPIVDVFTVITGTTLALLVGVAIHYSIERPIDRSLRDWNKRASKNNSQYGDN